MKEKQIEILRRQEEGITFFPRTEECNRAFKEWVESYGIHFENDVVYLLKTVIDCHFVVHCYCWSFFNYYVLAIINMCIIYTKLCLNVATLQNILVLFTVVK